MTRKEFLRAGFGSLASVLAASGLTGCGSSPYSPSTSTSRTFTSTSVNGHTHTFTIQKADVQTPPASGISGNTSTSSGHMHSFEMTQTQLQTVMGGGSVVITTGISSVGGDHSHDITITKWF